MPWWIDHTTGLRRLLTRVERWEVSRFGRGGLGLVFRQRVLVLETTGRRTGQRRRTPVSYLDHADGYLVGGGAGGQTRTPDWVLNLRADPRATVDLGRGQRVAVLAREPAGTARDAAYAVMARRHPDIERYERWSGRPLPIFVLTRVE